MYHLWEDNDPAKCPYSDEAVRCVCRRTPLASETPVPPEDRNCESCAWGPHKLAIKRKRLKALRAKMEGER